MLAVSGYFDGSTIVLDKEVKMIKGQKLLVVLETPKSKRKRIDLDQYVTPTERGQNVDAYMEEMRGNDRI